MKNGIWHHEDLQPVSYEKFLREVAGRYKVGELPPTDQVHGVLKAEVNAGRWIVRCPNCTGAQVASRLILLFICVECGSPENAGLWYEVLYPSEKREIERLLLLRPALMPLDARNRNWLPNEPLKQLKRDNFLHGLGV